MWALEYTGDLAEMERCIQAGVDPNLEDMTSEEAINAFTDGDWNRLNVEDDHGLFWFIENGGTLISMAIIGRRRGSQGGDNLMDILTLLLKYGARANHPENLNITMSLSQPEKAMEIFDLLIQYGAIITQEFVISAFRRAKVEILEYFYEKLGIRLSRHDRDEVLAIIEEREQNTRVFTGSLDAFDDRFYDMYEKFTRRTPIQY